MQTMEFYEKLLSNKNGATTKQKIFAIKISNTLNIDLPVEDTVKSYCNFISENIEDFKKEQRKIRDEWNEIESRKRYTSSGRTRFQNTYSGAYDSDIVDCYDFGISPWGDS